jgi:hypothetical protein
MTRRYDKDGNELQTGALIGSGREKTLDAHRRTEDESRRHELEEISGFGIAPHEGMEAFEEAWAANMVEANAENVSDTGHNLVNEAIGLAVQESADRVADKQMSSEDRQAEAFVRALERHGIALGDDARYEAEHQAILDEVASLEAEETEAQDDDRGTAGYYPADFDSESETEQYVWEDDE